MPTEKEKMLAGELYDPSIKELVDLRTKAHSLCAKYNATSETDEKLREEILKDLLGELGSEACIQGPIQLDYGCFTYIGERTFINFNLTVLDTCPVHIGNDVFIGPNVSILTPLHPMKWQERNCYHKEDGTDCRKRNNLRRRNNRNGLRHRRRKCGNTRHPSRPLRSRQPLQGCERDREII